MLEKFSSQYKAVLVAYSTSYEAFTRKLAKSARLKLLIEAERSSLIT